MSHLSLQGIVKRYGDRQVVDGVDLAVERGELMCILGPSGCGKTTLLSILAGFTEPDEGEIVLAGRSIAHVPPHRRNMGMVFQNYALFPHLTVEENVAFGLRLRRTPPDLMRQRISTALALTHLRGFEKRYPQQLSGGQQQRVAMARVLAINPDVLLLDEPFSNLDAKLRREMREEVRRIQQQTGITTLFVTHDQEEALAISDRVAVMQNGRIDQLGGCREIYERPATPFVAAFIGESNRLSGTVASRNEECVTIECSGLRTRGVACGTPLQQGESALLFVRPERIAISRNGSSDELRGSGYLTLEGSVEQLLFLGARTRLSVRTPLGLLTVEAADPPLNACTVGGAVVLGWRSEDAVVLAAGEHA